MCPKSCFLSTCLLRLLWILIFEEFILLSSSIKKKTPWIYWNHISPPECWFPQEQKARTSPLLFALSRKKRPFLWDPLVYHIPNTETSPHQQQISTAALLSPWRPHNLCTRHPSQKFELYSIKLLHLTTLSELKKIIRFQWISLYTAASLMKPHKS